MLNFYSSVNFSQFLVSICRVVMISSPAFYFVRHALVFRLSVAGGTVAGNVNDGSCAIGNVRVAFVAGQSCFTDSVQQPVSGTVGPDTIFQRATVLSASVKIEV